MIKKIQNVWKEEAKLLDEFAEAWTHYFFQKVFSEKEMKEAIKEMLENWDVQRSNLL